MTTAHPYRINNRSYLVVNEDEGMEWPARRRDLDHIEYVWDQLWLFTRDMDNPSTTAAQLWEALL